jgi:hypothetical protein
LAGLDEHRFRDGVIFVPRAAFVRELRAFISAERIAQCREHFVVLLLLGVLALRFECTQTNIDVAQ